MRKILNHHPLFLSHFRDTQHSSQQKLNVLFACAICVVLTFVGPVPVVGRSATVAQLVPTVNDVASALLDEGAPPPTLLIGALQHSDAQQPPSEEQAAVQETSSDSSSSTVDLLSRLRRQAPNSDYYSNYYNDYYNNYYSGQQQQNFNAQQQVYNNGPNPYRPLSADRFDGNGNTLDASISNNGFSTNGRPQTQVINGQKYTYTPLFQYKATKGHKEKLFVPNLFG